MMPDRRRPQPVQWGILLALVLQLVYAVYRSGQLEQKVNDVAADVQEIKKVLYRDAGK